MISVQSLSRVLLFVTPWTAARQAPCPSPAPGACLSSCPSYYFIRYMVYKYFLPLHRLLFTLLIVSFSVQEIFGLI